MPADQIDRATAEANATAALMWPQLFTKRAVNVLALRTDGSPESNRAVIDWARDSATPAFMDKNADDVMQLSINTLEGTHWVSPGDYVVCGVQGELYPVKPDIFHATYDPALPLDDDVFSHFGNGPNWNDNVLAATMAALHAETIDEPASTELFGASTEEEEKLAFIAHEAAGFLRQWPDATAEAVTIHLRRSGFTDVPEPSPRALAAWKVFAFTLHQLDELDRQQNEKSAAMLASQDAAGKLAQWPGERALKAEPGPFDPAGLSPRS